MLLVFEFWSWWVIALALLVIELLAPGFFFLWLAIAAFLTGALLWVLPVLALESQCAVFAFLSILSILVWRRYGKAQQRVTDQPFLNQRGAQYIGRVFNLYEPIINGQGKIKVDDAIWKVQGEDCNISTRVKVTAVRGLVFDVEKLLD
ncbi:MAG: NfeD family protein [Methylococcaceae bacterium]|jgi:hypothetical protein